MTFLSVLLGVLPLAAQPGPLAPYGPEIQLTGEADAFIFPSLAADPGGGLQMVWTRLWSPFASDAWARRFDRGGHPSGPVVRLNTPANLLQIGLTAMPLAPGRSAVVWVNAESFLSIAARGSGKTVGAASTVSAHLLGADGLPLGGETQLDTRDTAYDGSLAVAPLSGGGFAASWMEPQGAVVRVFDGNAQPVGGEVVVDNHPYTVLGGLATGGFLAYWYDASGGYARRFGPDGQPAGGPFAVDAGPSPALRRDGSFLSATAQAVSGGSADRTVVARLWDAAGHRLGADIPVGDGSDQLSVESVAVAPSGDFLIVWKDRLGSAAPSIWARLFDAAGHPTGPAVRADSLPAGDRYAPRAVTDGHDWVIGWTTAPDGAFVVRRFSSACATPDRTLCLQDSRFRVDVTWHDPRSGRTGTASAIPQTSDTGAFWFFSPDNLELTVKVLDGRPVNGHFWVFYASLSDVEFTITVTDSVTGSKKTYHNPPYNLASKADTAAF